MIVPNAFKGYDDLMGDLEAQESEAQKRHLEVNPVSFLKWISETLREHRGKYNKLQSEHVKLNKASEVATIGLNRLSKIVKFGNRTNLDYLKDMHRSLEHVNGGMDYTLNRCKKILDEVTVHYQLVGETLKNVLADKYKKIAMRKELGLRLRDIDEQFERCFMSVANQKKRHRQLSSGIQKLMHTASIKMPPRTKEVMLKEDRIKEIALNQRKRLINKENPSKKVDLKGWELEETEAIKEDTKPETKDTDKKEFDLRFGIAIALATTIVGTLVLFNRGS